MNGALAVASNQEGTSLIFLGQIMQKGRLNVGISQIQGRFFIFWLGRQKTVIMGLPVPGGIHPGGGIKDTGLIQNGALIHLLVHIGILPIGIPLILVLWGLGKNGGVNEKYVHRSLALGLLEITAFGYLIGGVLFLRMGRPSLHLGIVRSLRLRTVFPSDGKTVWPRSGTGSQNENDKKVNPPFVHAIQYKRSQVRKFEVLNEI